MSIFKGERLTVEIYGESHSERIGGSVKGMPRFTADEAELIRFLARRKAGNDAFSTTRKEPDLPVFDKPLGENFGGDFSFYIENKDVKSSDYKELFAKPRPSHADYCSYIKDGTLDFSGGGRFSGRLTAPLCVIGGLCKQYLESKGVKICAFVSQIGKVKGRTYKTDALDYQSVISARDSGFPSLNKKSEMLSEIAAAKSQNDSLGGVIGCVAFGLKGGFGDNLFGGLEGKISSLVYAVPAVKGVEFGAGFDFAQMCGSRANDELFFKDGKVSFYSNNSGGINGGISNGADLTLSVAVRPTPSVSVPQRTVNLQTRENCVIKTGGRHDACIVPRAVPCIESALALALVDEGI